STTSASLCDVLGPRLAATRGRRALAPSSGRRSSAVRGRPCRSSSTDTVDPSQDSGHLSSPLLLPLVREAPFFDEVLGQLQAHHQLADFRARQDRTWLSRDTASRASPRSSLSTNSIFLCTLQRSGNSSAPVPGVGSLLAGSPFWG